MPVIDDLQLLGAPVDDPVATAVFIGGLVMTRRQKASLLQEYLRATGRTVTPAIREAADAFAEFL